MPLVSNDPVKRLTELADTYDKNPKRDSTTVLVCGEVGAGKTHFAKTCPQPVLLHMFDPKGEQTLSKDIAARRVIPDTRFVFSHNNPSAFEQWNAEMGRLERDDMFNQIGTLMVDSLTMLSIALLASTGRKWMDWAQKLEQVVQKLTSLPCHVVLTGHLIAEKDENTGELQYSLYTPGKVSTWAPSYFSEVYVLKPKQVGPVFNYELLTRNNGRYKARTRIGADGVFDPIEAPDFRALLTKANLPAEDKPIMKELLRVGT